MKYILFLALFAFSLSVKAQDYKQIGTAFVQTTVKTKTIKTEYTWEKGGIKYPIYLSSKGKAYIVRISKKTGKEYKQYLPDEVATSIKNKKR